MGYCHIQMKGLKQITLVFFLFLSSSFPLLVPLFKFWNTWWLPGVAPHCHRCQSPWYKVERNMLLDLVPICSLTILSPWSLYSQHLSSLPPPPSLLMGQSTGVMLVELMPKEDIVSIYEILLAPKKLGGATCSFFIQQMFVTMSHHQHKNRKINKMQSLPFKSFFKPSCIYHSQSLPQPLPMWSTLFSSHFTLTLRHPKWFIHFQNACRCSYPAFFEYSRSHKFMPIWVDFFLDRVLWTEYLFCSKIHVLKS